MSSGKARGTREGLGERGAGSGECGEQGAVIIVGMLVDNSILLEQPCCTCIPMTLPRSSGNKGRRLQCCHCPEASSKEKRHSNATPPPDTGIKCHCSYIPDAKKCMTFG